MKQLTAAAALGISLVFGLTSTAQAQALTPIKISYQPSLYWALPFHIATEKGWWKDVGLAPEFSTFPAGVPQIAASAAGSWDVGGTGSVPAVLGHVRFGIKTIGDLMRHYPRRYMVRGELSDISALHEGDETTILAQVYSASTRPMRGRKGSMLEVVVTDGTDKLSLTFFNQAWREKDLKVGRQGLFAGKVGVFNNKKQLSHPDYEMIPDGSDVDSAVEGFAGKYLPVYPASAKMPSWKISQCAQLAIGSLEEIQDFLPSSIREKHNYPSLHQALVQLHQPADLDHAELARERLTFDEAFLLQSLLVMRRIELKKLNSTSRKRISGGLLDAFDATLPFELTAGQVAVSKEIESDLAQPHPMHRLLQGEVGSGKTIVALRAMLAVVDSGGQAALLAPTEVLAAQHLRTIQKLLGDLGQGGMLGGSEKATQVTLITGSQSAAARKEALAMAANGSAGIVIGTHALLGEKVEFKDLGLIVVDEQHRFGVEQRDALKEKAVLPPHLLVMTATPIPRTVAMTVFGDLDVSTLRELPLGRQPITTHVIAAVEKPTHLERAWQRIAEEVAKGHQAYVVAPRISATNNEKEEDTEQSMIAKTTKGITSFMGNIGSSVSGITGLVSSTADMANNYLSKKIISSPEETVSKPIDTSITMSQPKISNTNTRNTIDIILPIITKVIVIYIYFQILIVIQTIPIEMI